jgi:phosphoribosylaminoimidazolecarboxamide formyltransferase/IMP cyclohydrolase
MAPGSTGVVVVKHNNPCGVALVPKSTPDAQMQALLRAWEGDPVSAFGGVLVFTDPLQEGPAAWLSERFIELVSAPELKTDSPALLRMLMKRRNLKAVGIRRFGELPRSQEISVPGGRLRQTPDRGVEETLTPVTKLRWPENRKPLAKFGIAVCRALKSNAIALVREIPEISGALQLVGAGQGQPNRVEALEKLAVPRALGVLGAPDAQVASARSALAECVMVSDAFFPFRDTVDTAFKAGIRWIVQPGGSIKDQESIAACDEHGIGMVFTGVRHFRH